MKKKTIVGLITIVAIIAVLIFAGCIEEKSPAPVSTPAPTATQTDVSQGGTIWTLTTFIVGDDVRSPIPGTTITARFVDGLISGTAGCNHYSGSYTAADKIVINEMSWTERFCMDPEGIMQQEAQYLDILPDVTTYTIKENQLTLSTGDGWALVYQAELDTTTKSEGTSMDTSPAPYPPEPEHREPGTYVAYPGGTKFTVPLNLTWPYNQSLTPLPFGCFGLSPEPGAKDVPLDTCITVSFGRPPPIVKLEIEPEVEISHLEKEYAQVASAKFTFYPAKPLQQETNYTITITFGQTELPTGGTNFAHYQTITWNFTTEPIASR